VGGFILAGAAVVGRPDTPAGPDPAIPAGVRAFASLDVTGLWDHKALAPVRDARGRHEFAWLVESLVGLAPTDLDRLTLIWHGSVPDAPHVVVNARKVINPAAVAKTLSRLAASPDRPTGQAIPISGGEFAFVYPVDGKTVLLAPAGADPLKLADVAALLPPLRTAAGKHALTVGVDGSVLRDLPSPDGRPLPAARAAILTVDLGPDSATVRLTGRFATDAAAKAAEPTLTVQLREAARLVTAEQKKAEDRPATANAYPAPLFELLARSLTDAKVRAEGPTVVGTTEVKLDEAVGRVMAAVPDAALSPRGASAAQNNLKQIGIAIHNYHDVNGHCPGNVYGKDGTPLLSWRVLILPYMEQEQLYQRFKLDEAWDSPANKTWSQTAVRVFQVPGRPTNQPWETYFRSFTSPKGAGEHQAWLVDGESKGPALAAVTDGTSNTIMVVEAADAVPWARPDDLPYDGKQPLPRFGGPSGAAAALMGDGRVVSFRRATTDEPTLRRVISIGDGQPVNFP
jgi:hypothetical protein